ncbi:hypothetical protein [Aeromicrobium chenweiae]|uniref:Uncharacterized protein n=1 Tax=Aeromicrobium chenweiae TaxID=2079793 RepID=A0A2S0WMB9_9ACTN|nr:hypothetical protein [Aeromicrobium chenweiae]AWB92493.1 hypothetical protein C3E78_09930 [Aeromicrobium chenweiae]TGN31216.1 hypothetical protein E4L97_12640 [Aeromicrobium chenweiae]
MTDTHGEPTPGPESETHVVAEATVVEPTGHATIDEALDRLHRLDDLEITDHPEQFDAIHGVLRAALANAGRDEVQLDSP